MAATLPGIGLHRPEGGGRAPGRGAFFAVPGKKWGKTRSRIESDLSDSGKVASMIPKPLSDCVIVQLEENPAAARPSSRPRVQQGIALDVGPGSRMDGHSSVQMSINRGDRVFFSEQAGVILDDSGTVLLAVSERDIVAVVRTEAREEVPLWVAPTRRSPGGPSSETD